MAEADQYFLGYRQAEQQRLQRQAVELADESNWLFDQIDVRPGQHVVEIGCGPQGCLGLLAERVGTRGRVVGIERSEEAVDLARRYAAEKGLENVELFNCDGRATGLARGEFDLATARLVLVNVPQPEEIVAEMVALVRPGGVVALHEADWSFQACEPPSAAWDRLYDVLAAYAANNNIDLFVGKRTPRMLREAGLRDVQVRPLIHLPPADHPRRSLFPWFVENLRPRLLADCLIDKMELDECLKELKHHVDDTNTLIVSSVFFQVWGRKPDP